jgi:hypothetical protein
LLFTQQLERIEHWTILPIGRLIQLGQGGWRERLDHVAELEPFFLGGSGPGEATDERNHNEGSPQGAVKDGHIASKGAETRVEIFSVSKYRREVLGVAPAGQSSP